MKLRRLALIIPLLISAGALAEINTEIGTVNIDFRLRYENVSQDNDLKDAHALTLRTLANVKSKSKNGFYGFGEVENSIALIDDYNDTLGEGAGYSVVADPTTTELDQLYLGYQQKGLSIKLGRQMLTMANHRYVGHVAWRNDKQTYDAISFNYQASEKLTFAYAYLDKRNRIFANKKDIDSQDHIFNASYKTPFGKIMGYGYLLEEDDSGLAIDTYGISLNGKKDQFSYLIELATQTKTSNDREFDSRYMHIQAGAKLSVINVKLGYEVLGSDDAKAGFITPLATLHKFNGWADQFLSTPDQGLQDLYATVSGKVAGGKWATTYHVYNADEATDTIDDLGSEINLMFSTKVKDFPISIKYANYSAGDIKVDTDKLWLWTGYKF